MKKTAEKILLYGFNDEARLMRVRILAKKLKIHAVALPPEAWREKIGFLLGSKGFRAATELGDDGFVFPREVMVMQGLRGPRLDQLLQGLQENEIEIPYKAVVTPFNTLWSLRRLCETMQKEHAALAEKGAE